jgi:putative membrane protein
VATVFLGNREQISDRCKALLRRFAHPLIIYDSTTMRRSSAPGPEYLVAGESPPRGAWYIRGVAARFLDDAARAAFASAIEAIEGASAAEIVVAVRRRSASYRHANVVIGAAVAVGGLAAMLFSIHEFALTSILIDPFVVGGLAGAAVELLPGVKRLLSPRALRRREVVRAARATFIERGVHRTRDRTGVLVYISCLEREVVLVPDTGIERVLAGDPGADATRTLTAAMPDGGAAVARELGRIGPALAAGFPRRGDDVNELPDDVDSDLERGGR